MSPARPHPPPGARRVLAMIRENPCHPCVKLLDWTARSNPPANQVAAPPTRKCCRPIQPPKPRTHRTRFRRWRGLCRFDELDAAKHRLPYGALAHHCDTISRLTSRATSRTARPELKSWPERGRPRPARPRQPVFEECHEVLCKLFSRNRRIITQMWDSAQLTVCSGRPSPGQVQEACSTTADEKYRPWFVGSEVAGS